MDVVVLLATATCGALGVTAPLVLASAAAILTAISARRKVEIARTYPDLGSSRVLVGALFLSLANNAVFSLLAFLLGRVVSLLF
jgi:hypothetical protein